MIFLFPRWDMLIPWRVIIYHLPPIKGTANNHWRYNTDILNILTQRIQVCPKKGITPTFLFFLDGIGTLHSYSIGRGLDYPILRVIIAVVYSTISVRRRSTSPHLGFLFRTSLKPLRHKFNQSHGLPWMSRVDGSDRIKDIKGWVARGFFHPQL